MISVLTHALFEYFIDNPCVRRLPLWKLCLNSRGVTVKDGDARQKSCWHFMLGLKSCRCVCLAFDLSEGSLLPSEQLSFAKEVTATSILRISKQNDFCFKPIKFHVPSIKYTDFDLKFPFCHSKCVLEHGKFSYQEKQLNSMSLRSSSSTKGRWWQSVVLP